MLLVKNRVNGGLDWDGLEFRDLDDVARERGKEGLGLDEWALCWLLCGPDWKKNWTLTVIFKFVAEYNGSPSRSLLPLLQEQAVPQVEVQPRCARPKGAWPVAAWEGGD